jgi:hypothetical protein
MPGALLVADNWSPVVTPLAAFVALGFVALAVRRRLPAGRIVVGAIGLFLGLWIGIMGTGHLFGVATKLILGILPLRNSPWRLILFGLAIAIPGWYLAAWSFRTLWHGR